MNGAIGGLIFGALLIFVAYQIYINLIEFPIGQILSSIIGFLYLFVLWSLLAVYLITKSRRR